MSVSSLSQNMTLMPERKRPKSSVVTWLPSCHHSPLHGGYTSPSPSNCDCCSFCSGFSCSDSEMKLSTKGERLASKNKTHELDIRCHGMTALQKLAWGERCCLQTKLGWGSTGSFAGYRNLRVSLSSSQDKHRNCFQIIFRKKVAYYMELSEKEM